MWFFALTLSLLACGGEEEAPPTPTPTPPAAPIAPKADASPEEADAPAEDAEAEEAEEAEEEEAPEPEEPEAASDAEAAERGLKLARAGHDEAALAALEPLLAGSSDADVWSTFAAVAASTGSAGAVLERIEGQLAEAPEDQLNLLRARLALAAGKGAVAMEAAKKLKAANAELGAVLLARAARAGGGPVTGLDIEQPADALVIAATRPGQAAAALEKAAVTSWEALALRAEIKESLKDMEGARADREAAMSAGGDAAVAALAPVLAAKTRDPEKASALYQRGAKASLARYDGIAAGAAAEALVDLWLVDQLDPVRALEVTSELDEDQIYSRYDYAPVRVQIARAAIAAGDPGAALAAARDVAKGYADVGDTEGATIAGWYYAQAALQLSRSRDSARAALYAGEDSAAAGLHHLLVGRPGEALARLKDNDLPGVAGVHADLAAARAALSLDQDPAPYTGRAVSRADESGDRMARIEARLERHRFAMAAGDPGAGAGLAELRAIADELGDDGVALKAEVAARTIMGGGEATVPRAIGADAAAWDALAGGEIPKDSKHPMVLWARARAEARSSAPERLLAAYSTATEATPVHRRGTWAPISVLDGHAGPGIETDLALLAALPPKKAGMAALRIHEWHHAVRAMDAAFAAGDDPSLSMARSERDELNTAFQALRSATLVWLAGGGDRPTEAARELEKLEISAMEVKGFARAIPAYTDDISNLQDNLKSQAIISIRLGPTTGDMVVLTATDVRMEPLRDFKTIVQNARKYRELMETSARSGHGTVDPIVGDAIRAQVLDTIQEELRGIGRYLVIPDGPLWGFSLGALPEQRLGRRYMADIRTITVGVTVSGTLRALPDPPQSYNPDFLGLSPRVPTEEELRLKLPTEVENAGRLFGGGLRNVKTGEEATAAVFTELAPTARYLHLANVPTGDRAALRLADKDVSLAQIRDMDLVAQVVVISADSSPAAALRRIQAFEAAGAGAVLVSTWLVDEKARGKLFFAFYDARNRDLSAARALAEARRSLTDSDDADYFQPSWWGQYLLAGQP